jgi:hypothetical protein
MIEFIEISLNDFKFSFEKCKNEKKWFYEVLSSINTSSYTFFTLKYNKFDIGLLINYEYINKNEFGICIYEEYRRKGFGTQIISLLQLKNHGNSSFTVNRHNVISKLFFNKLAENKILLKKNLNFI